MTSNFGQIDDRVQTRVLPIPNARRRRCESAQTFLRGSTRRTRMSNWAISARLISEDLSNKWRNDEVPVPDLRQ